jgi:folate-binding Fe-S cluster repair protein YgfZ
MKTGAVRFDFAVRLQNRVTGTDVQTFLQTLVSANGEKLLRSARHH